MSTQNTASEIATAVTELAQKFQIKVDPKTGVATVAEGVYEANLPESVSIEALKDLSNYNATFLAAQGLALGEASIPVLKKNDELAATTLEVVDKVGNKFSTTFHRTKLTGAPGGEKTEKYGQLSASIELRSARKTGQFGKVRTHLAALATAQLVAK